MSETESYKPHKRLAIVDSLNGPEKSFSELLEYLRAHPLNMSSLRASKNYYDRVSGRCYGMATKGYGRGSLTPTGPEVAKLIRRILEVSSG